MAELLPFLQEGLTVENLVTLAVALLALGIGWLILKFVLKMAWRAFSIGCIGILLLGGIWAVFTFFLS